jgi:hypothetical protein
MAEREPTRVNPQQQTIAKAEGIPLPGQWDCVWYHEKHLLQAAPTGNTKDPWRRSPAVW